MKSNRSTRAAVIGAVFKRSALAAAMMLAATSGSATEPEMGGAKGTVTGAVAGAVAGGLKQNEAATTLLLIDNRSGVQISAAEGSAKNYDFSVAGGLFGGGLGAGAGAYSSTPQGKIITAAFADSYNQMVGALKNYKAQTVRGGLGTGGRLGVDGGTTAASKEIAQPAAKR